jgi:Secretion system C-terminal sorting domain
MKKIYLLTLSLAVTTGMWAQKGKSMTAAKEVMTKAETVTTDSKTETNHTKAPFDVIWSEDFGTTTAGGVPTGWTQGGTNQVWKKTFAGSTGCFGTITSTINSTTKANGVLIYDADSLNEAITADCTGGAYGALSGDVISSVIDLTAKPNVRLEFQQYFRLCCSPTTTFLTVSVSGNGGATWTDYDAKGATAINSYCANPETVSINISAVAGGSNNVKVKFRFESGLGVYFWQIDDVKIIEGPANDVKLVRSYADFSYDNGGYYTQTPAGQIAPITFRGAVLNDGGVAQTAVKMDVNITGAGTYTQTSNTIASFPLYGTDTLRISTPAFTPSTVGVYNATYTVSQTEADQLISNNTASKSFKITDTVYARDAGGVGAGLSSSLSSSDYVGGDVAGSMVASLYEFPAAGTITTASAYVATTTQLGASFDFVLFNIDATGNFVEVASSDVYTVNVAADRNKWVTMPFLTGVFPVLAGESYILAVRQQGAPASDLDILSDLTLENTAPEQTAFVNTTGAAADWGWIQKVPFIRLNMTAINAGINETANSNAILLQNVPNPAIGSTTVNFEIVNANNVSLSVYDVAGKLVKTINEGNLSAGKHAITVKTADLDAGIYFYTLTVGDQHLTKKMSVMKK